MKIQSDMKYTVATQLRLLVYLIKFLSAHILHRVKDPVEHQERLGKACMKTCVTTVSEP